MLEFINNNGVLFSGVFGLVTALATAIIAIIVDKRKAKNDTVNSLKKELAETKAELEKYTLIERQEELIDKSTGAIYVETLPNGSKRNICGYCWESKRSKMPLTMASYYDDDDGKWVVRGICGSCNARCYDE